ncbi:AP-2 complex subunit sigma [Intoshia linei]|uniref:AP complex subunit sigma n=1 Tax=Intoshia linei TaxID=1819745 RepID=A0A177AXR8_9BILA|nr:AP-2 complex subunit sigma [Intoshia linei]
MLRFILIQNRSGKTRIAKWFVIYTPQEQNQLKIEVHAAVAIRNHRQANIIEFRQYKIVYKRYASLFVCFCIDQNDNALYYLEAGHNFVETINEYFHNVCEQDLVYNFHKVYDIIDTMFLAGEVRETSQTKVLKHTAMLSTLS